MRVLLALAVWIVTLGGVGLFVRSYQPAGPAVALAARRPAAGVYALELTTSFSAQRDPFTLAPEDSDTQPPAVLVKLAGQELLRRTEDLPAGQAVVVPAPGLVVGENEFYLEARPPIDQSHQAHALRVRILRDGQPVAEKTFWSQPPLPLIATFPLDIPPQEPGHTQPHDHDHH